MNELEKKLQGLGMDEVDAGSSMPIIKILQKSAAEVDETHENHDTKKIDGAKSGDLLFMAESSLLPRPVEFIPLSQKTLYAEWRPKTAGGGLVGHHPTTIQSNPNYHKGEGDKKYKEYLGDNELVLTIYYMVMFRDGDEWKKAILSFASSNLKHARALGKQIRSFRYEDRKVTPFIFSRSFNLDTSLQRGHGNSWYEFHIIPNRVLDFKDDKELLTAAVDSREEAIASLPQAIDTEPKRIEAEEENPF